MTMENPPDSTRLFDYKLQEVKVAEVLKAVYEALAEKGYNPVSQIVGYLLSGDPAYITSHKNARHIIRRLERDELLEELVRNYLAGLGAEKKPEP